MAPFRFVWTVIFSVAGRGPEWALREVAQLSHPEGGDRDEVFAGLAALGDTIGVPRLSVHGLDGSVVSMRSIPRTTAANRSARVAAARFPNRANGPRWASSAPA